jgi:hypothetical protein
MVISLVIGVLRRMPMVDIGFAVFCVGFVVAFSHMTNP